jgi:hypothetical protein
LFPRDQPAAKPVFGSRGSSITFVGEGELATDVDRGGVDDGVPLATSRSVEEVDVHATRTTTLAARTLDTLLIANES